MVTSSHNNLKPCEPWSSWVNYRSWVITTIWRKTIDAFLAGVGTGGTLSGVGKVLKKEYPNIEIVAIEPEASPVLSGGEPGPHKLQGLGAGFIPGTLNTEIYDSIIKVGNDTAMEMSRRVAKEEGILAGISSGAAIYAAIQKQKN